jgi:hypothetical protein
VNPKENLCDLMCMPTKIHCGCQGQHKSVENLVAWSACASMVLEIGSVCAAAVIHHCLQQ